MPKIRQCEYISWMISSNYLMKSPGGWSQFGGETRLPKIPTFLMAGCFGCHFPLDLALKCLHALGPPGIWGRAWEKLLYRHMSFLACSPVLPDVLPAGLQRGRSKLLVEEGVKSQSRAASLKEGSVTQTVLRCRDPVSKESHLVRWFNLSQSKGILSACWVTWKQQRWCAACM